MLSVSGNSVVLAMDYQVLEKFHVELFLKDFVDLFLELFKAQCSPHIQPDGIVLGVLGEQDALEPVLLGLPGNCPPKGS